MIKVMEDEYAVAELDGAKRYVRVYMGGIEWQDYDDEPIQNLIERLISIAGTKGYDEIKISWVGNSEIDEVSFYGSRIETDNEVKIRRNRYDLVAEKLKSTEDKEYAQYLRLKDKYE